MKRALTTVAVVSVAALALPLSATAAPHNAGRSAATAAKPTGTVFFVRSSGERNAWIKASGGKVHALPGYAETVLPAPKKHELVYSSVNPKTAASELNIASYSRKVKHTYKVTGLGKVLSVSPNAKYVGSVAFNSSNTKEIYRVRTIKGKVVSTLFTAKPDSDNTWESWNAAGTQVAVLSEKLHSEVSSLTIYTAHGKLVRTLVKSQHDGAYLSWSKTGTVAYGVDNKVMVVKSTGGTPTVLFADTKDDPQGLAYSPDGKFLAYGAISVQDSTQKVWLGLANGTGRHVVAHSGSFPTWG